MSELSLVSIVDFKIDKYEDVEIEKIISKVLERQDLKDVIAKVRKDDQSDKEFIKSNIEMFDLLTSFVGTCDKCTGIGECPFAGRIPVPEVIVSRSLDRKGQEEITKTLHINHVPCSATEKLQMKINPTKRYVINDLEDSMISLVDSEAKMDSTPDRIPYFKWFKNRFSKKSQSKPFAYIMGEASGRTYIAANLVNWFTNKLKGKAAFINSRLTSGYLQDKSIKDRDGFNQLMFELANCNLLVLDNLGSEYTNSFIRDGVWSELLRSRASNNKTTIINSDYQLFQLKEIYADGGRAKFKSQELINIIEKNSELIIELKKKGNQ